MKKAMLYVCWLLRVDINPILTIIQASSTNAPGTAAPHVVEALRKAGISGPPDTPEHVSQSDIESVDQENQTWVTEDTSHTPATSILKSPKMQGAGVSSPVSGGSSRKSTESKSSSRRKSVTFAEGTKLTDAVTSKPNLPNSPRALKTINEIKRQAGLTKLPTKSIKPNKPSNRKLKRLLEADGAGDTGQADFGQATKQNANDVHHDALENPKEDSGTAVATNEAFIETTIGHPTKDSSSSEAATAKNAQYIEAEVQEVDLAPPIMSADESPEDAALRRQMLAYSMNEVGAVVAEIELDEEEEDPSDASNTDDEDGANSDASSLEEEEDEHGRTKRRVLNDATLEEMRALEERLNATAIQNVGPHGNGLTAPVMERSSGNIIHDSSSKDLSYPLSKTSIPKEVRFAEELDLQDMPVKNRGDGVVNPFSKPVKDNIIERVAPVGGLTEPNAAPKTVSRFKSTRAGNTTIFSNRAGHDILTADARGEKLFPKKCASPKSTSNQHHLTGHIALTSSQSPRQVPTGPPNRTHAPTVIERPYSAIADSSMAVEPDELDPALLHQQVATEYHRMRNRIVQRQGGFLASDVEKECVPLTEEEGGAPKISRFKAARLARM